MNIVNNVDDASDSPSAQPTVTDQYCFDYSGTLISTAIAKREKAAEDLRRLVVWLWSTYTAASAVGITVYVETLSFWPALFVALASTSGSCLLGTFF